MNAQSLESADQNECEQIEAHCGFIIRTNLERIAMKHFIKIIGVSTLGLMQPTFGQSNASERDQLKQEIIELARSYDQRDELLDEARATLDPLVERLSEYNELNTIEDQLPVLVGAWKEIWSDEREPGPPFITVDRKQTYQVIYPEGFFYNVSELYRPLGKSTGVLKGTFATTDDLKLKIEFVQVKSRIRGLPNNADLQELTDGFEAGRGAFDPPGDETFPNGPVGVKGYLENIYLDDSFRVAIEKDLDLNVRALFILERAEKVVK